jgi:two-component system osmolarity sensor histidine kinase EnvZ
MKFMQSDDSPLAGWLAALRRRLSRFIPKRLFPRTLIIVAAPLVLLQSILVIVSMERHWQLVTARLSEATARDMKALLTIYRQGPHDPQNRKLLRLAASQMGFDMKFMPQNRLPAPPERSMFDILGSILREEIDKAIKIPHQVDTLLPNNRAEARFLLDGETMRVIFSRRQSYAYNTHIFIVWMIGSSAILLLIAVMFLRNQIKPILQLSEAAERFGRGQPLKKGFRPHGALEIRQASMAFVRMRDRIERHVEQRTTMLAGVSHDLRTILTRFKLELALAEDSPEIIAMRKDVDEMQAMINAYMDFAKGDGNEETRMTRIDDILDEISSEMARMGRKIPFSSATRGLELPLRRSAFKRALNNLAGNAARHASRVEMSTRIRRGQILIIIDDDGPGIPEDMRKEVFQPFVRLDDARTQSKDGAPNTGLGLAIARDIVHSHGGRISLDDSPLGGLRATIYLPL